MIERVAKMLDRAAPIHESSHIDCDAAKVSYLLTCQGSTHDVAMLVRGYLGLVEPGEQPCELIVVANGLSPDSLREIREVVDSATDVATLIELDRHREVSQTLRLALDRSTGERIVVLPAASRSLPADVQAVVESLSELDYVATVRRGRNVGHFRRLRTKLYNRTVEFAAGVKLRDINSGLCGMRRGMLEGLPLYGDLHLFIPVLAARQGFRIGEVEISPTQEHFSDGAFRLRNYLGRALDLFTLFFLTGFTEKPFRLFGSIGAALAASGCLITSVLVIQRILGQPLGDRPLLTVAVLLVVMGIQLLSLGLLGELIIFVNAGAIRNYSLKESDQDKGDTASPTRRSMLPSKK